MSYVLAFSVLAVVLGSLVFCGVVHGSDALWYAYFAGLATRYAHLAWQERQR